MERTNPQHESQVKISTDNSPLRMEGNRNGARTGRGKERRIGPCQDRLWGMRGVQLRHLNQQRLLHKQSLE
jgi:hypothetical protein